MSRALIVALLLAGCSKPECGKGELRSASGECVKLSPDETTETDTLTGANFGALDDDLPDCVLQEPGTSLSLQEGCALGVCDETSYETWVAVLGPPDECDRSLTGFDIDSFFCKWMGGELRTFFDDEDQNDEPDPGSGAAGVVLDELSVPATSPEGLGIGVSGKCYLEAGFQVAYVITDSDEDGTEFATGLRMFGSEGSFFVYFDDEGFVDYMHLFSAYESDF